MESRSRPRWAALLGAIAIVLSLSTSPEVLAYPDDGAVTAAPVPQPQQSITIPVPADVTAVEARAVEVRQTDTLKHLGDNEVTIDEATRDPAQSPDPGSGSTFWIVGIVAGAITRPAINFAVARWPAMPDDFAGVLHFILLLVVYLGAWAVLHRSNGNLPQDWESWVGAAIGATGGGTVVSSGSKGTRAAKALKLAREGSR